MRFCKDFVEVNTTDFMQIGIPEKRTSEKPGETTKLATFTTKQ